MRWLAEISTSRPVAVTMAILVVLVFGLFSVQRLSVDLLPDIQFPTVAVVTTYRGAGPAEVEKLVSNPIEQAVSTITNVKNVRSASQEGSSVVTVEFEYGTDMDYAALQVREKVEQNRGILPKDADAPVVFKFDPKMMPVIFLGMGGTSDGLSLRKVAEETVKPALERIPGVAAADVFGGDVEEVKITLDQNLLNHYGITFDDINRVLWAENISQPAGTAKYGKSEYVVRTLGEFRSTDDIGKVIVSAGRSGVVYLKDIATIERTVQERSQYSRMSGRNSVGIQIRKQSGASTVAVSRRVMEEIKRLESSLPPGSEIKVIFDQAKYTQRSINDVYSSAYQGAFLAALVLYIFLRSIKHTLVIGVSIPVSIVATFIMMYLAGLSINLESLGGLALGVGMMVDNSIVVLENIYRWAEAGHDPRTAAIEGTVEVGGAITGSTLTNVAVFLPIIFIQGITAQFFRELALTVTFSLLASLVIAVTVVPMVSYRLLLASGGKVGQLQAGRATLFGRLDRFFGEVVPRAYLNTLRWALSHKRRVAAIGALSVVLTFAVFPYVGRSFFPSADEGQLGVSIELPAGTTLDETDKVVMMVERECLALKEVDAVFSRTGQGGGFGGSAGSHRGRVDVQLVPKRQRSRSTNAVVEYLRARLGTIPGAKIRVEPSGFLFSAGFGAPVSISIKGKDLGVLEQASARVMQILSSIPGTRNVRSSIESTLPEAQIVVDRDKAAQYGLTTAQVASAVRTSLSGQASTKLRVGGNEITVRLWLPENQRKALEDLGNLKIPTIGGGYATLADIAAVVPGTGPTVINRENQSRVVTISCQLAGRDLGSVVAEASRKLRSLGLPPGYSLQFGGESQQMTESFKDLSQALVLAALIIYMILAAQFESLLQPFVIMLTVPLSGLGAIWGLFLTARSLNVISFTGLVMLIGIVVNNAIVLIEYTNILRRRDGMSRMDALLKAGPARLRPILMTSLTTILGLVPLSLGIGEGAESQAPLATVIMGGMVTSTLLTLIVIPVAYDLFERFSDWLSVRIYHGRISKHGMETCRQATNN